MRRKDESNMFKKGDYIMYGNIGTCEVVDITTMNIDGVPKNKLYYILRPYNQKGNKVFTPIDNQKIKMRPIVSKERAYEIIDNMSSIEELWIGNDKLREENYKECMRGGECTDWIKIIKTLYVRKQKRMEEGKKITSIDEKYLKIAEEYLLSECSIAIGISKEEMRDYILKRVKLLEATCSESNMKSV